ncbi:MAG TPA: hypothetical protein VFG89_05940 [Coriobacteriia bacterium]|nr:hypothetical protein [Coriobacteriia bacterium]
MTRKQFIALTVTVAALAAAVTAAWAVDANARKEQAASGGYRIEVTDGGSVLRSFTSAELAKLPKRRVAMQGQPQEGPSVLSVLKAAGVKRFNTVTVVGQGVRDDGRLVLKRAAIDEDVLLDFAVRGTAKVCGPDIAWEDRVRDVERLEVR